MLWESKQGCYFLLTGFRARVGKDGLFWRLVREFRKTLLKKMVDNLAVSTDMNLPQASKFALRNQYGILIWVLDIVNYQQ